MSRTASSRQQRQRLKIKLLLSHPLQSTFYSQTTKDENDRFVEDLRQHGQRDAIVVVPVKGKPRRYMILDGHRRVWAFGVVGWDGIEAIIRYDLADADEAQVEAEFLQYNLNRRHLHQIDRARIALRQFQIEKGRPRGVVRPVDEREARDRVGKVMDMSGRNLSRYFQLLLAPLEVQNAVRDGELGLVAGEKVARLPKEGQAEIAERLRAGEQAKDVVAAYMKSRNGRHQKAADGFFRLLKDIERALDDLEDRPHEVYRLTIKENTPLLERGRQLITKLMAEGRKKPGSIAKLCVTYTSESPFAGRK